MMLEEPGYYFSFSISFLKIFFICLFTLYECDMCGDQRTAYGNWFSPSCVFCRPRQQERAALTPAPLPQHGYFSCCCYHVPNRKQHQGVWTDCWLEVWLWGWNVRHLATLSLQSGSRLLLAFSFPPFNNCAFPGRRMVFHLLHGGPFSFVTFFWKHPHKVNIRNVFLLEILNSVRLIMKINISCEHDTHIATLDCSTVLVYFLLL